MEGSAGLTGLAGREGRGFAGSEGKAGLAGFIGGEGRGFDGLTGLVGRAGLAGRAGLVGREGLVGRGRSQELEGSLDGNGLSTSKAGFEEVGRGGIAFLGGRGAEIDGGSFGISTCIEKRI